jgi:soluble lytic murein transglycosylase
MKIQALRGVNSWVSLSLFALAMGGFAACSSAPEKPEGLVRSGILHGNDLDETELRNRFVTDDRLSEMLSAGYSGLDLTQEPYRGRLIREARAFVRYQTGGMGAVEATRYRQACERSEAPSPLCLVALNREPKALRREVDDDDRPRRLSRGEVRAMSQAVLRGDLAPLTGKTDLQVLSSMKPLNSIVKLARLEKAVSQWASCISPGILSALGMKLEQELQNPEVEARVIGYYERAVRCGGLTDLNAMRARYRLSLLKVGKGEWVSASEHLDALIDHPEATDYRSRAIYWRYRCARKRGERRVADALRERMQREFPMSLHGLLMNGDSSPAPLVPLADRDPRVRFRSEARPDLNDWVQAAEAVQAVGGDQASLELLEARLSALRETEPEFQLYFAVLLRRTGDAIRKFQLLAGLFRDHPHLISRQGLELMFPLRQFELIQDQKEPVDPYLVIALMRQESAFNVRARSRVGAVGLMQVMPATARRFARVGKAQLMDPRTNVKVGVRYFSGLLQRFGGEAELALAAYNAGPERVEQWLARYPADDRLLFVDLIPFRETREYVASIARNYYWYRELYLEKNRDKALARSADRNPASAATAAAGEVSPFLMFR